MSMPAQVIYSYIFADLLWKDAVVLKSGRSGFPDNECALLY